MTAPDRAVRSSMKVCRVCGVGVPGVVDSRPDVIAGEHTQIRTYKCSCGAKYRTLEVSYSLLKDLSEASREMALVVPAIQSLLPRLNRIAALTLALDSAKKPQIKERKP